MSETAIKFENISKEYRLGLVSTRTLSHDLNRWWQVNVRGKEDPYLKIGEVNDRATKGNSEYVWALRDINLEVKKGDVLGIIGKNGAGKSTLLKILSKVTTPSTGSIKAKGRIASLLEVGTGFHPEMTGRENIFMNGAIMGMTKAEITRKLDEIVDFSGIERYLDTPVKRYSSGMTVRLGFAIAAHLEPDILVVDEVLAVGDAEFQKKAIGKMQDVSKGEGRTVLFVSHNMASMQQLCKNGILLKNGTINLTGEMNKVISYYQQQSSDLQLQDIGERTDRQGNGKLRIKNVIVKDISGNTINSIIMGMAFRLKIVLQNNSWKESDKINELSIGINDEYGQRILVMNNIFINKKLHFNSSEKDISVEFIINKCPLNSGEYGLAFYLHDEFELVDWIDNIFRLVIDEGDFYNTGKVNRKGLGKILVDYELVQN